MPDRFKPADVVQIERRDDPLLRRTGDRGDREGDHQRHQQAKDSLQHLNSGGIVSSTGELGGQWDLTDFEPISAIPNNCYLTSFYSGDVQTEVLQALLDLIQAQHVDLAPAKVFSLATVAMAHREIEGKHSFGKLVVVI